MIFNTTNCITRHDFLSFRINSLEVNSKSCFETISSDVKTYIFCCALLCSKLGHANTAAEVAVRNCNELNWFYAEEFFAEFFIDAALEKKV